MTENMKYDAIIIGGGPAGLTAGLYASRAGLKSLLLEKGIYGGQITYAEHVENFPGFPEGVSGMELGEKMREQAGKYGLEFLQTEATGLIVEEKQKSVKTLDGEFTCGTLILAGGSNRRKLGVPGEAALTGRGVSYCATCDAAFFRDQPVVVVGGGDAALTEALHLTKIAGKVTLIHRRGELRATRILQERAFTDPKMSFIWNTTVDAIEGKDTVKQLKLTDVKTGKVSHLATDGVFIAIGFLPDTDFVKDIVKLDETGHVITNEKMETSVPGVFAAGDIRHNSGKQAKAAAGDGATAAIYAQKYLTEH
ncbi:MAG: thioredoxin-disulfide reductase [Dehalococcoidales bacterium]|nr:thioredoxin-disulfide reductase [Dehalococcoidales bacterium]